MQILFRSHRFLTPVLRIIFMLPFLIWLVLNQGCIPRGFTEQGNSAYNGLIDNLIQQEICSDPRSCSDLLQMYREDGERIYLSMYGHTDLSLPTTVSLFFLENGLKLSSGMPITLKVFSEPKSEHLGLKGIFSQNNVAMKLELNK